MSSAPSASEPSGSPVSLRDRQLHIAGIVAAYFAVSISLVFVNKVLLSEGSSIPAPLFVTWFQCVVTVGICWAFGEAGRRANPGTFFAQFPAVEYKREVGVPLLRLSGIFVAMVAFNNLCLKYVEASFYNVARSLTIVFNVALTYLFLHESTSRTVLACLAVVVVGFFVGSSGEVRFSLIGTAFGVVSSVFVSLYSVAQKKYMDLVQKNAMKLSAYNNINACILFLPFIALTGELSIISQNFHMFYSAQFWTMMLLGGVTGFGIGIVTTMQIKATSPLTHNISGTAKACVQTILAFWIWQNPTTVQNVLGIALVLAGSCAFTYVRNEEMKAEMAAKGAPAAIAPAAPAQEAAPAETAAEDEEQGPNAERQKLVR